MRFPILPSARARAFRVGPASCASLVAFVGLIAFAAPPIRADDQAYQPPRRMLWLDADLSTPTGAEDILSTYSLVCDAEDWLLRPRLWDEGNLIGKAGGIAYRIGKDVFLDEGLLSFYAAVGQHEIFGHGYRGREADIRGISYTFSPPWPYGDGTGLTTFGSGPAISADREIALTMGGVEASAVLGRKLRGYWFQSGAMDFHGSLLYLDAIGDLHNYLSQSNEDVFKAAATPSPDDLSNDMLSYASELNGKEGAPAYADWKLHIGHMDSQSNVIFFDPFYWYSLWTLLKVYGWGGESVFHYPAIPAGPLRLMPTLGYGLTPWGPEYRAEGLAGIGRSVYDLSYRWGDDVFHPSWGWDLDALEFANFKGFTLDGSLHLWKQPRLRLDPADNDPIPSRFGFGESLSILLPAFSDAWPLRVALGEDFKTEGFVPGEALEGGATWRVGLAF